MGLRERLSASAAEIKARSQRLVELNVELLTNELKRKAQQYGTAIGVFVAAGVLALFALGFALTTITVALSIVLPLWLSLLIVTAALLLVALILALVGRGSVNRAKTPAARTAGVEARATADVVTSQLQRTVSELAPRRDGGKPAAAPVRPPLSPPPLAAPSVAFGAPDGPTAPTAPPTPPTSEEDS
jgi:hypothetical protein